MPERTVSTAPLFEGADWDFDTLRRTFDAIEKVARSELQLDTYPAQVEIISSEQMLDAYSSIGMPLMYRHWSYGKHFVHDERLYRKGAQGLAYEIVINSNPCIAYCMEDNSMALQALVMAHAAFGHNHFFKNNHLFRQWTEPESIIDYLEYARDFVVECEERHGIDAVEQILDAAHAVAHASVFRHRRPPHLSLREERGRRRQRAEEEARNVHYLWDALQPPKPRRLTDEELRERSRALGLPEENLLYFIETNSPVLREWQRELLRIVRNIAQYFYPQKQTKMMNEGCACFAHFQILGSMHRQGLLTDGAMLEILHSHTNVLTQPDFDDQRYSGINPYALGFAMMQDIKRICEQPTDEDRDWFPDIAGQQDWRGVLKDAWANYRDESFIEQFLSPTVMRRFHMFALSDETRNPHYVVTAIHDERGFNEIRSVLARNFDLSMSEPDIQVVDVDLLGDRRLKLRHNRRDGISLDPETREATLRHLRRLWGYEVVLDEVPAAA